jgi:hypothetical protein
MFKDIDYAKINDADEEDLMLVTCTPVMAKRNLNPHVPETPFLTKNTLDKHNATPLFKGGGIVI